jgi:hypothetical protein
MSPEKHINIEKALKLANNKTTTIEKLCEFIMSDIQAFKDSREVFYLEQFKEEFLNQKHGNSIDAVADEQSSLIFDKIQKDTKKYTAKYAQDSIDCVLDAKNQKKFKTKIGFESLLVLLSTLKEINEE